jgi:hypothetical protein
MSKAEPSQNGALHGKQGGTIVMEQLSEWVVVLVLFSVVGFSVAVLLLIADYRDRNRRNARPAEGKAHWKKAA